jgi:hypothetical protein
MTILSKNEKINRLRIFTIDCVRNDSAEEKNTVPLSKK